MTPPARRLSPVARRVWILQQVLFWGALTIVGVVVTLTAGVGPWFLIPLVIGIAAGIGVPRLRWARWRWDINDEGIDIQRGTLAINRTLVPWIRVQHVDTRRGIFEQIFSLATVVRPTSSAPCERRWPRTSGSRPSAGRSAGSRPPRTPRSRRCRSSSSPSSS